MSITTALALMHAVHRLMDLSEWSHSRSTEALWNIPTSLLVLILKIKLY